MDNFKLNTPVAILVGCLIVGGFYYAVQSNKQNSIERQQQLDLALKEEQNKKQYIASQKGVCLDIYESEGKKWNNVTGWYYNESTDVCSITYKDQNPKTKAQCEKSFASVKEIYDGEIIPPDVFIEYLHCLEGTFQKTF